MEGGKGEDVTDVVFRQRVLRFERACERVNLAEEFAVAEAFTGGCIDEKRGGGSGGGGRAE